MKPEGEWNFQARSGMWSLGERPGFLRLHAFPALHRNDFGSMGNVLTQRAFRTRSNQVTITLDLSAMVEGQESGLVHFAKTYCSVGVLQSRGARILTYNHNGDRHNGAVIAGHILFLRSVWGVDGKSRFSYSTDGRRFRTVGEPYDLTWGSYRGDRVGIFTVNPKANAGYLDVDSFEYRLEP